jgi:hypothetical protein
MNISDFCYKFIEENKDFLDLKKYDMDYSQKLSDIDNFIKQQKCCKEYFNFVSSILKASIYVSCDDFINILNFNMEELINKYLDHEIILIMTQSSIAKSNIFYSLYFLYNLNKKNIKIKYIYETMEEILDENRDIKGIDKDKQVLMVLCDDISFSGSQISLNINSYNSYAGIPLILNNRIKIFLNVVGLLPEALKIIKKQFHNKNQLIIPNKVMKFENQKTIENIINLNKGTKLIDDYIKTVDCYILEKKGDKYSLKSLLNELNIFDTNYTTISLVYSFQKFPDAQSTYSKLCFLTNLDNYIFNLLEFIKTFNLKLENIEMPKNKPIDFDIFLNKLFGVNIGSKIISDIIINKKISWLDKCEKIQDSTNIFENDYGSWFKSINNFRGDQDYLKMFKGNCSENNSVIIPFYKNLKYKLNSVDINILNTLKELNELQELSEIKKEGGYRDKYLKYKLKYLRLKML